MHAPARLIVPVELCLRNHSEELDFVVALTVHQWCCFGSGVFPVVRLPVCFVYIFVFVFASVIFQLVSWSVATREGSADESPSAAAAF